MSISRMAVEAPKAQVQIEFYDAFLAYIENYEKREEDHFCGDINTAHESIDLARPKRMKRTPVFTRRTRMD